jgi:DNA helicase IV
VVVDWRADIARTFYRATSSDPMGLLRRRRFGFQHGRITSLEDELLGLGEELEGLSPLVAAEIERPRTGPMRDIVATIQPDQDEIVRASLDESVCVQGGPGTGKTAVGLHRAAYLLYAFESQLRTAGVLVVGPNRAFIQYVNQVLPALGEVDVEQMALEEVIAAVPLRVVGDEAAADVKHDPRMAEVIRRAIEARMVRPQEPLAVRVGVTTLRLDTGRLERLREASLRRGLPYEAGRKVFRDLVADHLLQQAEGIVAGVEPGHVVRALRASKPAQGVLDAMWPKQDPVSVVHALLTDGEALRCAAEGVLTGEEQRLLAWPRAVRKAAAPWTRADLVLIDEASGVISRPRSYGHVVVDEAQDLSPMQLRAVGRRCQRSVTLLGDLAQATTPWASRSWDAALAHLGIERARRETLSRAFRIQASVLTLANRLLAHIAPGLPPAVPVRDAPDALTVVPARPGGLAAEVAAQAEAALAHPGSLGVVVPDRHLEAIATALGGLGVPWGPVERMASGQRVTLVEASQVKGLEFDTVVLAEPAAIAAPGDAAHLRLLYIALTRAVLRLVLVHAEPLPPHLAP